MNVVVDDFARPFVDHVHVGRRYAAPKVGALEKVQRVTALLTPYAQARAAHGRFENRRQVVPERRRRRRQRRRRRVGGRGRTGRRHRRRRRRRGSGRRWRRVPSAETAAARGTQRTTRTVFVVVVIRIVVVVRVFLLFVNVVVVAVRYVVDETDATVVRRFQIVAPRTSDPSGVRLRRTGNAKFFAVATVRRRRRRRRDHADDGVSVFLCIIYRSNDAHTVGTQHATHEHTAHAPGEHTVWSRRRNGICDTTGPSSVVTPARVHYHRAAAAPDIFGGGGLYPRASIIIRSR